MQKQKKEALRGYIKKEEYIMDTKWSCPICGSKYEGDITAELPYGCCIDTIIERDKEKRRETTNLNFCKESYKRLENYILGKYDNFEDIGFFHIEYSHNKGELQLEIMGEKITEEYFLHKVDRILEGIYDLWQKENEPYEGKLYELMLDFEILKEEINKEEEKC